MIDESRHCECWRLTTPLWRNQLLDHVCVETMVQTVQVAIQEGVIPPSSSWPAVRDSGIGDDPFHVGLVLRVWVEGQPSSTLARVLADNLEWRRLVLDCQLSGVHLGEWLDGQPVVSKRDFTDEYLSYRLRAHRLLHTPSTVREAAGQLPLSDQPAPGMLVVTQAHVWCFGLDLSPPHLCPGLLQLFEGILHDCDGRLAFGYPPEHLSLALALGSE